jgi:hypothetical protein
MTDEHQFLHGMAEELRTIAGKAPEVAEELRRMADHLEQLARRGLAPRSGSRPL